MGTGFPLGFSGFGDNGERRASGYSDGRAFTPSEGLRRAGDVAEEGEEGEEVMTPMSGGLGEAKQGEGLSGEMRGALGGDGAGDYAGLGGRLKRGESKHRRE